MARRLGNISRETIPLLILFVAQQKPSRGGLWHPILMQFYSGPLMQLLSGVDTIPETGKWLAQVVAGYFAYHAVPTNSPAIAAFRYHVVILWHRQLLRRSQRARLVWTQMAKLVDEFLPKPRILHPWPSVRFAVKHPR